MEKTILLFSVCRQKTIFFNKNFYLIYLSEISTQRSMHKIKDRIDFEILCLTVFKQEAQRWLLAL